MHYYALVSVMLSIMQIRINTEDLKYGYVRKGDLVSEVFRINNKDKRITGFHGHQKSKDQKSLTSYCATLFLNILVEKHYLIPLDKEKWKRRKQTQSNVHSRHAAFAKSFIVLKAGKNIPQLDLIGPMDDPLRFSITNPNDVDYDDFPANIPPLDIFRKVLRTGLVKYKSEWEGANREKSIYTWSPSK